MREAAGAIVTVVLFLAAPAHSEDSRNDAQEHEKARPEVIKKAAELDGEGLEDGLEEHGRDGRNDDREDDREPDDFDPGY